MTNYERIKNMSVEEMAEYFTDKDDCDFCVRCDEETCLDVYCPDYIKQYLESEVETE